MVKKERREVCDICGGSGQLSFFKGESRFLLSTEECSECAGTGLRLESFSGQEMPAQTGPKKMVCARKGKK